MRVCYIQLLKCVIMQFILSFLEKFKFAPFSPPWRFITCIYMPVVFTMTFDFNTNFNNNLHLNVRFLSVIDKKTRSLITVSFKCRVWLVFIFISFILLPLSILYLYHCKLIFKSIYIVV